MVYLGINTTIDAIQSRADRLKSGVNLFFQIVNFLFQGI